MNVGELKTALRGRDDTQEVWVEAIQGEATILDVLGEVREETGDLHLVGEEAAL